ncbi:Intraflagellar transport protein [Trichinella spiralis]|uniref:Intraflagellar transport protein 20-like protein n=2 Tax=Trichinella spiralis TaxID=6334 RepID=A0A0V1B867_TRISP|nr:Intraflagellar transport protein 20 -like protein [Trichinella spiralis]
MADRYLSSVNLYLDELNKLRLLNPETGHQSENLSSEVSSFIEKNEKIRRLVEDTEGMFTKFAEKVELQKFQAINARNLTKDFALHQSKNKQRLEMLIKLKRAELERLRKENENLQHESDKQQEMIRKLIGDYSMPNV